MGLGSIVLGIASLALGAQQMRSGARQLRGVSRKKRENLGLYDASYLGSGALQDSGRSVVRTPSGKNVSMRMRSYKIRTLDDRVRYLRQLVDQGKRDPQVYAFARRSINARCGTRWCIPEKDNLGEARAVFKNLRGAMPPHLTEADLRRARSVHNSMRRNVRYTSDIAGVDTYQKPSHTLALRSGDCDDYSATTCSALGSIGIPCGFEVIRTKGAKDWNHIYAMAGFPRSNPTRWIPMDSSVNKPFGWRAPDSMVAERKFFRVT
jgi:hypothetical protein